MPADLDGLLRLVRAGDREVTAAIETMSGAAWVAETLQAAGWRVQVADCRKARASRCDTRTAGSAGQLVSVAGGQFDAR